MGEKKLHCKECGRVVQVTDLGEEDPSRSQLAAELAADSQRVPVNNFHLYRCEKGHKFSWSDPAK